MHAARLYQQVLDAFGDEIARADGDAACIRATAAFRLGHVYLAFGGHRVEAEAMWRIALELDHPEVSPWAAYCVANILRDARVHPAEVIELYRQAAEFGHPDVTPMARLELGDDLRSCLQEERARREYEAVLALGQDYWMQAAQHRLDAGRNAVGSGARTDASPFPGVVVGDGGGVVSASDMDPALYVDAPRVVIVGAGAAGQFLLQA